MKKLSASRNKISELPEEFENLINLELLNLSSNQIKNLKVSNFVKLVRLDLSNNKLSNWNNDELSKMDELKYLDISNNEFEMIPELPINLTILQVYSNPISELDVSKLVNLQTLNISDTKIGNLSLENLNLTNLILGYNKITEFPNLEKMKNLQSLCLIGNQIEDISKIDKLLPGSIQDLFLSSNRIKSIPNHILDYFNNSENLCTIDLSFNNIETIPNLDSDKHFNWSNQNSEILKMENLEIGYAECKGTKFKNYTFTILGRRATMEDSIMHYHFNSSFGNISIFGVFDGHAGPKASNFCSKVFGKVFQRVFENTSEPNISERISNSLKETFSILNKDLREYLRSCATNFTDQFCGTTAGIALFVNNSIFVANVGDTRIVLYSEGKTKRLTVDHKPHLLPEKERIFSIGGHVIFDNDGVSRVNGNLAIARSLGDFYLSPYVISEPYIEEYSISGNENDFLIIAWYLLFIKLNL